MMDLSLILFNNPCGISSMPKESQYAVVFLSRNNETKCIPLLCLSSRFVTYAPFFILAKLCIEQTQ